MELTKESKRLLIELAKSLGVDFPKDKTCKDCFHCQYEDDVIGNGYVKHHHCWNHNKTATIPCDFDDMSHRDYISPYNITQLKEAMECPYYKSGLEEYKRLYEESKKELDDLKSKIMNLCK